MIYREGFQAKRRYLIKRMILKLNVLISLDEFDFLSVTFLHSSLSRLSTSSTHKSFGYIPAMTLHFLHGFSVSFHASAYCSFVACPAMELSTAMELMFSQSAVPHLRYLLRTPKVICTARFLGGRTSITRMPLRRTLSPPAPFVDPAVRERSGSLGFAFSASARLLPHPAFLAGGSFFGAKLAGVKSFCPFISIGFESPLPLSR